jgi:hypothetical protein
VWVLLWVRAVGELGRNVCAFRFSLIFILHSSLGGRFSGRDETRRGGTRQSSDTVFVVWFLRRVLFVLWGGVGDEDETRIGGDASTSALPRFVWWFLCCSLRRCGDRDMSLRQGGLGLGLRKVTHVRSVSCRCAQSEAQVLGLAAITLQPVVPRVWGRRTLLCPFAAPVSVSCIRGEARAFAGLEPSLGAESARPCRAPAPRALRSDCTSTSAASPDILARACQRDIGMHASPPFSICSGSSSLRCLPLLFFIVSSLIPLVYYESDADLHLYRSLS